ncbi:MAG: four helix bundle protein [Marinilabiliales bacterium]|nr:four helix bundle protein [Marinilabiliales bacterium]
MAQFRFMDLEIWKESIALNDQFFDLADTLIESRSFRVAEQLRSASLSISNNIAEGSGSLSAKEFANFLNISHRSIFETANISFVAQRRGYITNENLERLLADLESLSRKITNFRKSILNNNQ